MAPHHRNISTQGSPDLYFSRGGEGSWGWSHAFLSTFFDMVKRLFARMGFRAESGAREEAGGGESTRGLKEEDILEDENRNEGDGRSG